MREIIRSLVQQAIHRCQGEGLVVEETGPPWTVETPKRPEHGDYSTNAALVLASRVKRRPMELAGELAARLEDPRQYLERVEAMPPGFLNFFLSKNALLSTVRETVRLQGLYGRSTEGEGVPIQVEFVSANPTGPLHIGHGRGAAVGDALAAILETAGYRVFREYYVNDMGRQMEMLGRSVYLRYLQAMGRAVEFPEDHYKGSYIQDLAGEILEQDGARWVQVPEQEALSRFTDHARETILGGIRKDLEEFRVKYDGWFRESALYHNGKVQEWLDGLRSKELVYERDGALWFRSSAFGDEKDRVVVRSDGRTTYLASDIAYHADKFSRGFSKLVDIWGADHHGYVPRLRGVVKALGRDPDTLQVVLVQMVNLLRDGVPVAMSTRAGEFTTLREVLDEVGVDASRYIFLMRSSDSPLDFDLAVAKRQERANPVYYVQYAYARICSILEEARDRQVPLPGAEEADLSLLHTEEEWELIKHLVLYPEVLQMSARTLEPHRLTYFLDGLAADFHTYYNRGWVDRSLRVISDDPAVTQARLLLVQAVQVVLRNALGLLGVTTPGRM